jgi:site-specific DNA-methyltransferase (adenine-specific)
LNTKQKKNGDKTFVGVEPQVIPPINTVENIDCMEMLKKCPPKYFDLAIVDPPYGIGRDGQRESICKNPKHNRKEHIKKSWDTSPPPTEYFEELFRVSKNQIIWGGNYFIENLYPSKGWMTWYKGQNDLTMSDIELAWSSFNKPARQIEINRVQLIVEGDTIHPTQKPVKLYRWLLGRYAAAGDLILDTHVGSGSSIIACIEGGFNYYGCEIDKEYYEAAKKRIGRAFRKYELEFADEAV